MGTVQGEHGKLVIYCLWKGCHRTKPFGPDHEWANDEDRYIAVEGGKVAGMFGPYCDFHKENPDPKAA